MIFKILVEELPYLMQGVLVVVELAAGLLALGLIVGLVLALMEVYGNRLLALSATSTGFFEEYLLPISLLLRFVGLL